MPEKPTAIPEPEKDDVVVATLKKRYFELASKENIGHTPKITAEVDHLEQAIRALQSKGIVNPT